MDACRIVRLPYHLSAQTQAIAEVALNREMLPFADSIKAYLRLLLKDEGRRAGMPSFKILGASWATYRAVSAKLAVRLSLSAAVRVLSYFTRFSRGFFSGT